MLLYRALSMHKYKELRGDLMTIPVLPIKSDINGNPTAGTYKTAIGQFYDYVAGLVASMIPYTPGGRLTSTDVQSAISELDSEKLAISGGTLTGALHQPNPIDITSAGGVLTLTEGGNSFVANGSEPILSISGLMDAVVMIRWNTSRTLTYNATSFIMQGVVDRVTSIGDIGLYEISAAGVREVNYFPAKISSGNPVGALTWGLMRNAPSGYLKANGAAISRTTYANLINNTFITIPTTGNKTSGSATITNIPTTVDMAIGMHVEGNGIPSGATITSINSLTSITLSANLTATVTGGALIVFPFGNGDGSTTANLPDLRGEHLRAFDDGRNADTTGITLATTSGSNTISAIPDTSFMFVGMPLSGTGIPVGATVASITSLTAITISANATATSTGVLITFTGRRFGSWESDDYSSHNHVWSKTACNTSGGSGTSYIATGQSNTIGTVSVATNNTGGSETRGRNYALPVYIKY